jgi:hypothetical protein
MTRPLAGRRGRWPALAIGGSAAIMIAGLALNAREAAMMFLVAYVTVTSIVLGAMALVMISHVTTATWFVVLRRRAMAIVDSLPAVVAAGVLVLAAIPLLYPWAESWRSGGRAAYLSISLFVARSLVYWTVWLIIGESLRAAAAFQDRGGGERAARRLRITSAAGLVALGVTMTFAAFDWMMSLTPDWWSTVYGVYWFAGGVTGALALLAVVALYDQRRGRLDALRPDHYQALGTLLLTFVLLWAYAGFSQYIVIWSGDLPREVTWYVARTQGGWGALALTLVFGTFAIPTLLLFFRPVKRSGRALAIIGSVLLVLHALDMLWVVVPGQMPMRVWTAVMFAAALVVVGGGTAAVAEWRQRGWPPMAIKDPLLLASEQYRAG